MTWESRKASRLSWQWHKKGQRAQANWVAAIQVMLSKVIYNAVAAGHVNCWNHRNWNLSDRIPNIGSWKNVLPCEPRSESLIVTLTYFALFKEVLPCMFVISVPSGKHFNLRVGFIIGEPGRENQTLKYIGWKYQYQVSVLLVSIKTKPCKTEHICRRQDDLIVNTKSYRILK